jgi:hypothetical protein
MKKKEWVKIKCINCEKEFSVIPSRGDKAKFCSSSCAAKTNVGYGENNHFWGKKHSEETKKIFREKNGNYMRGRKRPPFSEEWRENMSKAQSGKKKQPFSEEHKRKMSEAQKGEKGSNWQGGISQYPYPEEWTDSLREGIRNRDNYICQECGIHQCELIGRFKKLDIHHIDYDKDNLNPKNLISLCRICHAKTNINREYWISYFNNQ